MSVKPEQIEYLKLRKALDKALRDNDVIEVDYEYDLGRQDVRDDSMLLISHLAEAEKALVNIREMMR